MTDEIANKELEASRRRLRIAEALASVSRKDAAPKVQLSEAVRPYTPPPGVLAPGGVPMAMDDAFYGWGGMGIYMEDGGDHFLGYPKLAELAQRPEYRVVSEAIADEMVRKWIRFDGINEEKIEKIEKEFRRLKVRDVFKRAALHDGLYGMGHIFIQLGSAFDINPSPVELRTGIGGYAAQFKVEKGSLRSLRNIEPMWTYPGFYTASDPLSESWYKPQSWHVMGREIHASRLLTFVGREVSDMLKPSYNFGGISLSQMVKPYVDNWLRIREDVGDTVEAFSTSVLKTDMFRALDQLGQDAGLTQRIDLFTRTRSVKGVMMVDKETEDFAEVAKPLSTLDALQAQAQEHMASVTRIPLVKLLGIQPSGLNASADGEMRVWEDNILGYQETMFRPALEQLLPIVMMSVFGEIYPELEFSFVPLHEMTEKEKMEIRKMRADIHLQYIQAGVFGTDEVREAEINEADSLYAGLDPDDLPEPPQQSSMSGEEGEDPVLSGLGQMAEMLGQDEFREEDHPRREDGKFGSGRGTSKKAARFEKPMSLRSWVGASPLTKHLPRPFGVTGLSENEAKVIKNRMQKKGVLNEDGTLSLYHVTMAENAERIRQEGLVPAKKPPPGQDWEADHARYAVYCYLNREVAEDHASQTGVDMSVVEARIPINSLTLDRIIPDEDSSTNPSDGVKTVLEGGTVAFIGGFPANVLRIKSIIAQDEFREIDHDRDQDGKFMSTGGGSSQKTTESKTARHQPMVVNAEGKRSSSDGQPLPKHIASIVIPPAWRDVTYDPSPDADLLVTGLDAKGRRQSIYSDAHWAKSAATKFARIKALDKQFETIKTQNEEARRSDNSAKRDAGDCLALIMSTGIRPGSETDTGAEKQAYGATTLLGQHVVQDESGVYLQFVGKKGVSLNIPVLDDEMRKMILARKQKAGDNGQLFLINEKALLDHVHSLGDGSFKSKDFRTHLGTKTALSLVNERPAPKNEKEYKKAVKEVAVAVSKKLGNTPTVALQSYISPFVFDGWKGALTA